MVSLPGSQIWEDIAASGLAVLIRESVWIYPALETIHVIGVGLVFGSILALDLRILGLSSMLPVSRLARHLLPWVWLGFCLNAATGLLLFVSDAAEFAANPAFVVKLILIAAVGLNAAWFQFRVYPTHALWDQNKAAPLAARVCSLFSIAMWTAIIVAGRMIAYIA